MWPKHPICFSVTAAAHCSNKTFLSTSCNLRYLHVLEALASASNLYQLEKETLVFVSGPSWCVRLDERRRQCLFVCHWHIGMLSSPWLSWNLEFHILRSAIILDFIFWKVLMYLTWSNNSPYSCVRLNYSVLKSASIKEIQHAKGTRAWRENVSLLSIMPV